MKDWNTVIAETYRAYEQIEFKPKGTLTKDDRYPFADGIIKEVFNIKNHDISEIYKKVVLLNSLYSTNIFATFEVSLKISKIRNFVDRVEEGDLTLVEEIRHNVISGKKKDFYSFSTKYCHHSNPRKYPIYDSFVEKMLIEHQLPDNISKKEYKNRNKEYPYFKNEIDTLGRKWKLDIDLYYAKLDKFLWISGKNL